MVVSPIHPSPWITWKGQPLPRITCSVWGPATICDGSRSLVGPVVLDTGSPPCIMRNRGLTMGPMIQSPRPKRHVGDSSSCSQLFSVYFVGWSPLYSSIFYSQIQTVWLQSYFGGFDPQIRCLNVLSWSSETLSSSLFAKIFIRNPGIPSYWEPGSLPLLWMEEILRHLGW